MSLQNIVKLAINIAREMEHQLQSSYPVDVKIFPSSARITWPTSHLQQ